MKNLECQDSNIDLAEGLGKSTPLIRKNVEEKIKHCCSQFAQLQNFLYIISSFIFSKIF
jgi:hypothetical protein